MFRSTSQQTLPFYYNNNFLFCLCKTCAVKWNLSGEFVHESGAERALTSTWVHHEIRLSVGMWYKVRKRNDGVRSANCDGGLFVHRINTFLKVQAEASGYPSQVQNPEDEERYIEKFYAREGVRLDRDAIRPNAAKLGLAKLCLNSLCGRLTKRRDRTQTTFISDPNKLFRFLVIPSVEVADLLFARDSVVWASWLYPPEQQFRAYIIPTRSLEHSQPVVVACSCTRTFTNSDSGPCIATHIALYSIRTAKNIH